MFLLLFSQFVMRFAPFGFVFFGFFIPVIMQELDFFFFEQLELAIGNRFSIKKIVGVEVMNLLSDNFYACKYRVIDCRDLLWL